MSVLKEIRKKLSEEDQDEMQELDLSGIKIGKITPEITKFLEKYSKVQLLILENCQLQSLDNLPNWKIIAINVSGNKLTDSCLAKLVTIPTLTQISIVSNNIKSIDSLKTLSVLPDLKEIDFSSNPVTTTEDYSAIVFKAIPQLEYLDGKDKDGNELQDQEEFLDEDEDDDDEEDLGSDQDFGSDQDEEEQSEQKPQKKRK